MAVVWQDEGPLCATVASAPVGAPTVGRAVDRAPAPLTTEALCREYLAIEALYRSVGDRASTVRVLDWDLECPTPAAALSFLDYIAFRRMNDFLASRRDPLIVDCGANIGYTALWYKRLYPQARIIAFEPDPKFAPMLRRNLVRNHAEDVKVLEAAAWTCDGTSAWTMHETDGSRLLAGSAAPTDATPGPTVATIDLARLLDGLDDVDLLKIDIEGAEFVVVPHIAAQLARVRHVLVECHLAAQADYRQLGAIIDVLSRAGFTVALNSYGPWRDLVRQHVPAPLHAEQYLLVSGWRAGDAAASPSLDHQPALETEATMMPYAGIASPLALVKSELANHAVWEAAVRALVALAGGADNLQVTTFRRAVERESGHCWLTPIPRLPLGDHDGDRGSLTFLLEDGRLLGPAHAAHDDIRREGRGRYCHWQNALYWSTSDNSDPNTNGRTYALVTLRRS